jgi:hypothetical protein
MTVARDLSRSYYSFSLSPRLRLTGRIFRLRRSRSITPVDVTCHGGKAN